MFASNIDKAINSLSLAIYDTSSRINKLKKGN